MLKFPQNDSGQRYHSSYLPPAEDEFWSTHLALQLATELELGGTLAFMIRKIPVRPTLPHARACACACALASHKAKCCDW